jgi:hypothetical protein
LIVSPGELIDSQPKHIDFGLQTIDSEREQIVSERERIDSGSPPVGAVREIMD